MSRPLTNEDRAEIDRYKQEITARKQRQSFSVVSNAADNDNWPTLDDAALFGLAGDFVRSLSPHTEADPAAILVQFLVAFGNAAGSSPHYFVESDRHALNLFAVLVGASAKGRKGTSFGRARAIFEGADPIWFSERTASRLSSGEGLINGVHVVAGYTQCLGWPETSDIDPEFIAQGDRGAYLDPWPHHQG